MSPTNCITIKKNEKIQPPKQNSIRSFIQVFRGQKNIQRDVTVPFNKFIHSIRSSFERSKKLERAVTIAFNPFIHSSFQRSKKHSKRCDYCIQYVHSFTIKLGIDLHFVGIEFGFELTQPHYCQVRDRF